MEKTPFRKNLDKRYISGEDLLNGELLGHGLTKEMVVTLAKFNDAPAFDQKLQKEVDKTALWLKEFPSGKMIYKPCLLNVERTDFMRKELAGGSMFIDDCDLTKPFIIYARPDKRHGHVVAFKKHFQQNVSDVNAINILNSCTSLGDLRDKWKTISKTEQSLPSVIAKLDLLKQKFVV